MRHARRGEAEVGDRHIQVLINQINAGNRGSSRRPTSCVQFQCVSYSSRFYDSTFYAFVSYSNAVYRSTCSVRPASASPRQACLPSQFWDRTLAGDELLGCWHWRVASHYSSPPRQVENWISGASEGSSRHLFSHNIPTAIADLPRSGLQDGSTFSLCSPSLSSIRAWTGPRPS